VNWDVFLGVFIISFILMGAIVPGATIREVNSSMIINAVCVVIGAFALGMGLDKNE